MRKRNPNSTRVQDSVNYRGPSSFDLTFKRCKLTSPGLYVVCHRAPRFRKFCPEQYSTSYTLRKRERVGICHPPHSTWLGTRNWLECWLAPHRTVATGQWDFSRLGWSVFAVKLSGRGGGQQQCVAAAGLLMKKHQNGHQMLFCDIMSEVQKDVEEVSAGIGKFKKYDI